MNDEQKKQATDANGRLTKGTSCSKKSNTSNSNLNSEYEKAVKIQSDEVKVVQMPDCEIMKAYYYKKEDETILAVGQIAIVKKKGDRTLDLYKECKKITWELLLRTIAALVHAEISLNNKN